MIVISNSCFVKFYYLWHFTSIICGILLPLFAVFYFHYLWWFPSSVGNLPAFSVLSDQVAGVASEHVIFDGSLCSFA